MIFLAIKASNSPLTRPDIFERRNVNIMEESQKWLVLQYGYCLYYSGKTDEAIQHCQQVKEFWKVFFMVPKDETIIFL